MAIISNTITSPHGQRIAYAESSGTGPVVVFVHGNSLSGECFRYQLDSPLGDMYRMIALDLPGCGRSESAADPDKTNTAEGYVSLLSGFCSAMKIKDAVFVGWSLGGHILLEASDMLPARGYFIFGAPPIAGMQDFGSAFLPHKGMELIWKKEYSADDLDVILDMMISPDNLMGIELLRDALIRSDGNARESFFARLLSGWYKDERKAVETIKVPIAIIHGLGDKLANLTYIKALNVPTLWRNGVQIIDDATHAPQMEQPERFNTILKEFLDDIYGQTNQTR